MVTLTLTLTSENIFSYIAMVATYIAAEISTPLALYEE